MELNTSRKKRNWFFEVRTIFTCQDISHYDSPITFCGISLGKTDHVTQDRTMVIRGYPLSDLMSVIGFYFFRLFGTSEDNGLG